MAPKSCKWTYERECVLIEFYANHSSLWKRSAKCRKAENFVLVSQLAVMLDNVFTVEQIMRRFKCLRSTFRDNYNKVHRRCNISLGEKEFVPSFMHYHRLHFVIQSSERPANEQLCDTSEDVSDNDPLGDTAGEPVPEYEEEVDRSRDANPIGDHTYFPSPTAVYLSSTKLDTSTNPSDEAADAKKRLASVDETDATRGDAYAAFGRQVADSLRAMGPAGSLSSARAMMHIQEVLVRFHPDNPENPSYASRS